MTARDFLRAEHLHHTSVLDIHYASRIGLTTLKELVAGRRGVSVEAANRLQTWSLSLGGSAYISAAMTVGVLPPPASKATRRELLWKTRAKSAADRARGTVERVAEALGRPGADLEECIAMIQGATR